MWSSKDSLRDTKSFFNCQCSSSGIKLGLKLKTNDFKVYLEQQLSVTSVLSQNPFHFFTRLHKVYCFKFMEITMKCMSSICITRARKRRLKREAPLNKSFECFFLYSNISSRQEVNKGWRRGWAVQSYCEWKAFGSGWMRQPFTKVKRQKNNLFIVKNYIHVSCSYHEKNYDNMCT